MEDRIREIRSKALEGVPIDTDDIHRLNQYGSEKPFYLIASAREITDYFKGNRVNLCGIVNAKSGICPEDCKFCAQSVHYCTGAPEYPLISQEEMIGKAVQARSSGAHMFGIITSGTRIDDEKEWEEIYGAIKGIKALGINPCVSLGMLDETRATKLREAGLFRYHHNLETSRSYFDRICSTHDYEDDINTVKAARKAGLSTCSGGIIGLGESMEQRMELAFTLRELAVDCIPVNILNPRPGTPLVNAVQLSPIEILVSIALFRFILPDKDIKLCGGKEANLRQLLPLGIVAGCNSLMIGDYLTTPGRNPDLDVEMIKDLGLEPAFE